MHIDLFLNIIFSSGINRNVENRELRAHRRSVDRQNVKDKRLSVLRQLDLKISENSLEETPLKLPESSFNKEKQKKPSRIEMLHKWKAEKELRKKLEAKNQKPVFKVSHVKYSPPPVLSHLPRLVSNNSKEKNMNSFIPRPVTSKVALPESTRITRSKGCSMQDKGQRKPVYNRYNHQISKNQTQGASSTMKTSPKYFSNISFRNKGVSNMASSKRQKAQKTSAVAASKSTTQDVPDLDFTCEISNIEPHSSEVSFAPSNFLFSAPANLTSFVLSTIFDPSTKNENSGLLKRMSTPRQKPDNSECTMKNMAQDKLKNFSSAENHEEIVPETSLKNESVLSNSKLKDVDEAPSSDQMLSIERTVINSSSNSVNDCMNENLQVTYRYSVGESVHTNDKAKDILQEIKNNFISNENEEKNCLAIQQDTLTSDETKIMKDIKCPGTMSLNLKEEPNVESKLKSTQAMSNNSSLVESQNEKGMRNSSEKGLSTGVKDSLFNTLLETIDEKIEDCMIETDNNGMQSILEVDVKDSKENVPELDDGNKENSNLTGNHGTELQLSSISSLDNAEKSRRGKSRKSVNKARGSSNEFSQTPRRSARLSSFFSNSPTPLDSRFFQKSERYASPENDSGIPSAGLATFLEDTPQTALSRRLSRLSISHSLTAQQDQESTSRRPLTRSQDRISLLGTPQRRLTRSQKIGKEDLITFSPSV